MGLVREGQQDVRNIRGSTRTNRQTEVFPKEISRDGRVKFKS